MATELGASLRIWRKITEAQSGLLVQDKSDDRVGTDSYQGRNEALVEGQRTLLDDAEKGPTNPGELARLGVHESGLDHIERLRYDRGNASGYRGGGKVQRYTILCSCGVLEHLLHLVVGGVGADGQQDGPRHSGHSATEETGHAFLLVNAEQAVKHVLVAEEFVSMRRVDEEERVLWTSEQSMRYKTPPLRKMLHTLKP